jgi:hypothetical protein
VSNRFQLFKEKALKQALLKNNATEQNERYKKSENSDDRKFLEDVDKKDLVLIRRKVKLKVWA